MDNDTNFFVLVICLIISCSLDNYSGQVVGVIVVLVNISSKIDKTSHNVGIACLETVLIDTVIGCPYLSVEKRLEAIRISPCPYL